MAKQQYTGRYTKKSVKARSANTEMKPKKVKQTSSTPSAAVTVFVVIALCVSLFACVFFLTKLGINISLPSRYIAEGVTVAGVDVGGLTKSQAVAAVEAEIGDSYATKTLVVTAQEHQLQITPEISGAAFDVKGAVKAAARYGTEQNPAKVVDIVPYLNLDSDAINSQIREFSLNFPSEGVDGTYDVVQEFVTEETDEGEIEKEQVKLTTTVGSAYYRFDSEAVYKTIEKAYNDHKFETTYACEPAGMASIDLDVIYAQTCMEPVDASWDPEYHELTEDMVGYRFDLEAAKEALAAAKPGDTLEFPFFEVQPEVTMEALHETLFENELATYTAKASSSTNRNTNLRLACEALNGLILYPGDVFSYNETLGERTEEKGYKPADSYMGSETIQTIGGGICQPSSTLYYCALIADLEIVQRHSHTFISSYVPFGMDATVDWDGPDFKFSNNTNYPIRIDAVADGGNVTISLRGIDEKDYYVEMEYEILSSTSPDTVEETVSASSGHRDGEVKCSAYTGYTIQTYKVKYDKDTDEQISKEKEAYSEYSKRDKVVYKVVSSSAPTTPSTPENTTPTEPTTPDTGSGDTGGGDTGSGDTGGGDTGGGDTGGGNIGEATG